MVSAEETGTTSTAWDDQTIATDFVGGDGTEGKPYQISSGTEIARLTKIINENDNTYNTSKIHFQLTDDIDHGGKAWSSIGKSFTISFKGSFDGDGNKIQNLTINLPEHLFVGLLGCNSGKFINVGIEVGSVTGSKLSVLTNGVMDNAPVRSQHGAVLIGEISPG